MKQLFKRGSKLVIDEIPAPEISEGEILVQNLYSAVSTGTETKLVKSTNKTFRSPKAVIKKVLEFSKYGFQEALKEYTYRKNKLTTIGYSSVGIVLEKAKDVVNVKIGDIVACGGYGIASHAEIIRVPKNNFVKLPAGVDIESAAFTFIGAIALHSVKSANVKKNQRVAVIGLGLLGHFVSRILIAKGCYVYGFDLQSARVSLSKGNMVSTANQTEFVRTLALLGGANKVIVTAASETSEPLKLALSVCKTRGDIALVGNIPINIDYTSALINESNIVVPRSAGKGAEIRKNMQEFASLLKKLDISNMKATYDFTNYNDAFKSIIEKEKCSAVLKYSEAPQMNKEIIFRSDSKSKPNLVVIGLGEFAQKTHLPAIISANLFNIYTLVSKSGIRAKELAVRFGANKCSTDLEAALADDKIDLVYITSGDFQHAQHTILAAESKKAIFLEKPLAVSEKECEQIMRAVKKNGVFFALGLNRRHSELAQFLKSEFQNNTSPIKINWFFNEVLQPGEQKRISGAIRIACHYIDLVCWLLNTTVTSVKATGTENNFVAETKLSDGSVFNLTFATAYSDVNYRECVEIIMPSQKIIVNEFKDLEISKDNNVSRLTFNDDRGYKKQIEAVSKALNGEKTDFADLDQAVRSARFGFAVLKSLKTQKEIRF